MALLMNYNIEQDRQCQALRRLSFSEFALVRSAFFYEQVPDYLWKYMYGPIWYSYIIVRFDLVYYDNLSNTLQCDKRR